MQKQKPISGFLAVCVCLKHVRKKKARTDTYHWGIQILNECSEVFSGVPGSVHVTCACVFSAERSQSLHLILKGSVTEKNKDQSTGN